MLFANILQHSRAPIRFTLPFPTMYVIIPCMSKRESILFSLLVVLAVGLAFTAGYLARDLVLQRTGPLNILHHAHAILVENAFDPLPEDPALEYGMIRGMLSAYGDPFTTFSEPAQHELMSDSLEGNYGGIGVQLERNEAGDLLLFPFPEGPTVEAGIAAGDVLKQVDDLAVTPEVAFETLTAAIRGPEGTTVTLIVFRPNGGETLTISVQRREVPLPSVTWRTAPDDPRIGILQVNVIADTTPAEIEQAVAGLQQQGAAFFVLDLRNNGGGLLNAGIDCARLFLESGVIIQQQYRGEEVVTYQVEEPGPLAGLPLVVWVNQGTASAAEILAGALQANGRAPLLGSHTFGKDAIQLVFELEDGSSIQVTAAKWWFPDLAFPNAGTGLLPDVEVAPDDGPLLEASAMFFFEGP